MGSWFFHFTGFVVADKKAWICKGLGLIVGWRVSYNVILNVPIVFVYILFLHAHVHPSIQRILLLRYVSDACVAMALSVILFMWPAERPNILCFRKAAGWHSQLCQTMSNEQNVKWLLVWTYVIHQNWGTMAVTVGWKYYLRQQVVTFYICLI